LRPAAAGGPSWGRWWTVLGPLVMSVLLIRVIGAALLERSLARRRAGCAEYVARTSASFPCYRGGEGRMK